MILSLFETSFVSQAWATKVTDYGWEFLFFSLSPSLHVSHQTLFECFKHTDRWDGEDVVNHS